MSFLSSPTSVFRIHLMKAGLAPRRSCLGGAKRLSLIPCRRRSGLGSTRDDMLRLAAAAILRGQSSLYAVPWGRAASPRIGTQLNPEVATYKRSCKSLRGCNTGQKRFGGARCGTVRIGSGSGRTCSAGCLSVCPAQRRHVDGKATQLELREWEGPCGMSRRACSTASFGSTPASPSSSESSGACAHSNSPAS